MQKSMDKLENNKAYQELLEQYKSRRGRKPNEYYNKLREIK